MSTTPPEHPDQNDALAIIEEACTLLQGWYKGDLRFDDNIVPCRFVRTDEGRLVAPVMVAALHTADTVLMIPDEHAPVLELLLSMAPFEESGPDGRWADRWRIYHGEEEDINWAFFDIDMGRMSGIVIDGDALLRANPLAEEEAGVPGDQRTRARGPAKACVASGLNRRSSIRSSWADPDGMDVRATFDVLRIPFSIAIDTPGTSSAPSGSGGLNDAGRITSAIRSMTLVVPAPDGGRAPGVRCPVRDEVVLVDLLRRSRP